MTSECSHTSFVMSFMESILGLGFESSSTEWGFITLQLIRGSEGEAYLVLVTQMMYLHMVNCN